MADLTTLYNQALDKIGARSNISLPTEQSVEAEACNLWFPTIRDQVLASAPWPEATKMQRLALLSQTDSDTWVVGKPRPDLANAYALPADLLRPQFLSDFSLFIIQSYGDEARALMTDSSDPVLIYTFRQTAITTWSASLVSAITLALAASICTKLTGKTSRTKTLVDEANQLIINAREQSANTNDFQLESVPDWISARGYGASYSQQFLYPLGSLISVC